MPSDSASPRRRPVIALVAAMDEARTIGRDNTLPWHLPADLAHFKRVTLAQDELAAELFQAFVQFYQTIQQESQARLTRILRSQQFWIQDKHWHNHLSPPKCLC